MSCKGLYELPGGNLKFGEEIFASVERETLEETGLKIRGKKIIAYTNDIQKAEEKHEVTLYVLCEREDPSQQPEVSAHEPARRRSNVEPADTCPLHRQRSQKSPRAGSGRLGRTLWHWAKRDYSFRHST